MLWLIAFCGISAAACIALTALFNYQDVRGLRRRLDRIEKELREARDDR